MALVGLLLAEADYAAIAIMANRAYCVTQVLSVRCARPASKCAGVFGLYCRHSGAHKAYLSGL